MALKDYVPDQDSRREQEIRLNHIKRIRRHLTPESRELLVEWVAALRSGQYRQARRTLAAGPEDNLIFCCLGVLCEINKERFNLTRTRSSHSLEWRYAWMLNPSTGFHQDISTGVLPAIIANTVFEGRTNPFALAPGGYPEPLATLNDKWNFTFHKIADAIERTYLAPWKDDND